MGQWQLALELDLDVAPAFDALLEARDGKVAVKTPGGYDTQAGCEWRITTFRGPVDYSIIDAVGSWLTNFQVPETRFVTRQEGASWADQWRGVFEPFSASLRVWIAPSWCEAPEEAETVVRLDPSVAFGSGAHPTTVGCLNLVDRILYEHDVSTVLDVGAGSGILAIAAAKLGATVVGVEPDRDVVAESQKNVTLNQVGERVSLGEGTVGSLGEGTYDLVVANLYAALLQREAQALQAVTGDHLVISGFTEHHIPAILAAFEGLEVVTQYSIREWVLLHLRRCAD